MRALLVLAVGAAILGGLAFAVLQTTSAPDFPAVALDATRERPQGDVLRGPVNEPASINPFTTKDAVVFRFVLPYTHDSLLDRAPEDGGIRPCAAESHESSADGRTLKFRLRDDLVFADGRPVSAADVEFTLAVARDPRIDAPSDMSAEMRDLVDARVLDGREIELVQDKPLADGLARYGTTLRILSRRYFVEEAAAIDPRAADPRSDEFFAVLPQIKRPGPGTGPYQIATSEAQQAEGRRLDLIVNPWSWRRAARPGSWNLAGIRLEFVTAPAAVLVGARRQELDWYVSVAEHADALLEQDPELKEHFVAHSYLPRHVGPVVVLWNCSTAKLSSPRVRQALGMLFDREGMVEQLFHGLGQVTGSFFPPGSDEYVADSDWPRFAPEEAAAILAAEGVEDLEVELLVPTNSPVLGMIAEHAEVSFRRGGVTLRTTELDWNEYRSRIDSGRYEAGIELHQYDAIPEPYRRYHSTQTTTRCVDPRLDEVVDGLRTTTDPAERKELAKEFHDLERELQPMAVLLRNEVQLLLHRRFQDAAPGPLGVWIENWWVPAEAQLVRPEVVPVDGR